MMILSTSLGAVVYQHYCGTNLKQVSLSQIDKHCPDHQNQGMCHHEKDEKGCCKTEKQEISTSDKEKTTSDINIVKRGSQFVTVFYVLVQYLFSNPFEGTPNAISFVEPDPPLKSGNDLLVSHQQFLI